MRNRRLYEVYGSYTSLSQIRFIFCIIILMILSFTSDLFAKFEIFFFKVFFVNVYARMTHSICDDTNANESEEYVNDESAD